jgi:hypothetical protein
MTLASEDSIRRNLKLFIVSDCTNQTTIIWGLAFSHTKFALNYWKEDVYTTVWSTNDVVHLKFEITTNACIWESDRINESWGFRASCSPGFNIPWRKGIKPSHIILTLFILVPLQTCRGLCAIILRIPKARFLERVRLVPRSNIWNKTCDFHGSPYWPIFW